MYFDDFSTIGNRNEYSTNHVRTASLQTDYISTLSGKTKNNLTQKQPTAYAVHSVEPIVPDFRRKSFNVHFFPYLLENSFSSILAENLLHSPGFLSKIYFQTQYG